jgi:hypothetical protein
MSRIKRKKCKNCHNLFVPDARNRDRQKYCCKPACRKASKADSQKRWCQKPENIDYFRGPDNVERVQRWREANPGYSRRKPKTCVDALQDPLNRQQIENKDNSSDFTNHALQDLLTLQPSVLIGIIAQLTGYALQDDIAMAVRRMQQFGDDILNPQCKGGHHGNQTPYLSRSYPENPKTVQLARSPAGQ